MKRFVFYLLLLSLGLWSLLKGQQQATARPSDSRLDSLMSEKRYDEAVVLLAELRRLDSVGGQWVDYQKHTCAIAEVLWQQSRYDDVHRLMDQALGELQKNKLGEHPLSAKLWSWHALMYVKQERFPEALASYETAIQIYEKNNFYGSEVGYAYKNAAQIYMRYSNNRKALEYFDAGLRRDTTGNHHASILSQTAATWLFLDSLQPARMAYQKALEAGSKEPAYLGSLYSTGSELAQREGNLEEAERLTRMALEIYFAIHSDPLNVLRSYCTLADIAQHRRQAGAAEGYYRKAETFGLENYKGKSREMAILYLEWGGFYEKQGQTNKALCYYQKAIIQVFPGFDDTSLAANPPLSAAYNESQAMYALAKKGEALLKKNSPSPPDRLNAADCFDLSFAIAASLRKTFGDDADKISLAGENHGYQQLAARNLWQLWQEKHDPALLERLFQLTEQTKAQALADAVRQQRALALANLPDSLVKREATLRLIAADAAMNVKTTELSGVANDSALVVLKEQAFKAERSYETFLSALETTYPEFHRISRNDQVVAPSRLQTLLPDTLCLLSWFDAGDRYLCIRVQKKEMDAFEVVRDTAFDRQLIHFLQTLNDKSAQENDPAGYFREAAAIGQALLPGQTLQSSKALLIVPDGRLDYLPFEALLTTPYDGSFGNAPFLLRTHTVRYAWSAALLSAPAPENKQPARAFLHVAPFVETARDGLAPLPASREEQPAGVQVTALLGQDAQAATFLQQSGDFQVLQLSTHAHAGGRGEPGIEFFDRAVTLPEIYARRIPASLVALSACETGTGEYAEGEGVLSLARAFAYAGAESLMASHWSVNERATAELYAGFYAQIQQGVSRAEALRRAKLAWLDKSQSDARKAPWYWAAITLSGADGTIDLHQNTGWWWYAGCSLFVLLLGGWWIVRKRRV
ncbi:MAG TPA: CHAT domain-containing protein [Saprospiraceae bacterium]|nr:CHAT domain-containing protein [Saprospiraceae bacterium]